MSTPTLSPGPAAAAAVAPTTGPEHLLLAGHAGHLLAATWHPATSGTTSRVIVLAHGLFLSGGAWSQVTAALAAQSGDPHLAVLVYDHRGHGGTGCGNRALSLELLARDLAHVVDAARRRAGSQVSITVAGHSLGAMTCLTLLADERLHERAGQIDCAVLASASAGCLTGRGALRLLPAIARLHPGTFDKAQTAFRHTMLPLWSPAGKPACPIEPLPEAQCPGTLTGLATAQLLAALGAYDLRDKLTRRAGSVELPQFTLLCGTTDRITPVAHTQRLAHLLGLGASGRGSVQVLAGVGHNLPLEDPLSMAGQLHR